MNCHTKFKSRRISRKWKSRKNRNRDSRRRALHVESLEARQLLAVITNPAPGILQIDATDQAETIVLEDAPGVNNSQVSVDGGAPQVFANPANQLVLNAAGGDDTIIVKNLETSFDADILLNGGDGNDLFQVLPNMTASIYVSGGDPRRTDPGFPPGDVLALDLDNVIPNEVYQGVSSGVVWSETHAPVQWLGVEQVIAPDELEPNDSIELATVLGSLPKITLNDLSIHPRLDQVTGIPFADVIVVVDESASMEDEHAFLADFIPDLESALRGVGIGIAEGFGGNQYGLVGFGGDDDPIHLRGHSHLVGGSLFGTASEFVTAAGTLQIVGSQEDGYDGIQFALDNYPFRSDAARLMVLVTDEDRDEVNASLTQAGIQSALAASEVTLHGILNVDLEDGAATPALAVAADGTAYIADGSGGVITSAGGVVTGGFENTVADYVGLVHGSGGLVADLNQLRDGGNTATSFSSAMLIGLLESIEFPPVVPDVDVFQYTAQDTGMLIINTHQDDDIGDLDLRVLGEDGSVLATSTVLADNERIVMPVVTQQQYFIEVRGATADEVNSYSLEIENFAVPAPTGVVLQPETDTGMSNSDNVTADDTPNFAASVGLDPFVDLGLPVAETGGAGVSVLVQGVNLDGTASFSLAGAPVLDSSVWTTDNPFDLSEGVWVVTAYVRVRDAAGSVGEVELSSPLLLTIDKTAPGPSQPVLVASSDSNAQDGTTSVSAPAFTGVAEENAKVRLYAVPAGDTPDLATASPIGEGVATGIHPSQGLGTWEITSEPLADGEYDVFVVVIDAAGNASDVSIETPVQRVVIDTLAPQRPTIDLVDTYDTGVSATDNNTQLSSLVFRVTGDPGENTVVKDGNTVVFGPFVMPASGEVFVALDFVTLQGATGFPAEGAHPLSAESTDTAGNRSAQSEELLVTIDQTAPVVTVPDLLATSDTGLDNADNVTGENAPAFDGNVTLARPEAGVKVFLGAIDHGGNEVVLGETDWLLESEAIQEIRTVAWEITSEPLADGIYEFFAIVQDKAGNTYRSDSLEVPRDGRLTVEVDTRSPNLPFLDLLELSDTGRHNDDNVTADNTPSLSMTTEDRTANPAAFSHINAENLIFRLFDRPENASEVLLYDSFADLGDYTPLAQLNVTLAALADGIHNLKLEVEDRAGNVSADFLLDVLVDTQAWLGQGNLHPDSDTGVPGSDPDYAATLADLITSDSVPTFFGIAEANNLVYVAIDGVPAGTAVAVPLDGDDAFQPPVAPNDIVQGNWEIDTVLLLADGEHQAVFTFEDLAGNRVTSEPLDFFVDTQGPQFEQVYITGYEWFNLFDPKPSEGPTPLVHSLTVDVRDLPPRTEGFDYDALFEPVAENPGHYQVVGDHTGIIAIKSVTFAPDPSVPGSPATGRLIIEFFEPLPDDRFTIVASDSLVDPAGNALDGETNAAQPIDGLQILQPTGDGVPGGDAIARFTVDSRAELGTWAAGSVYVDTNGNFVFDPENKDNDTTNEDISYVLGFTSDNVFAGNFFDMVEEPVQESEYLRFGADGFDKLAAYGRVAGAFRWLIDTDNDGVPNIVRTDPANVNGLPVAGDFHQAEYWDDGDEVALKDSVNWYFDTDHDFLIDTQLTGNMQGYPIIGDFDGDGVDDLGSWTDDTFSLDLSTILTGAPNAASYNGNINAVTDVQFRFGFPGVRERPVAADMDGDGIDDIGLWAPDRSGASPAEGAEWYFLVSHGRTFTGGLNGRVIPNPQAIGGNIVDFVPIPFGYDIYAQFGDEFALPVVGNFDPPVSGVQTPSGAVAFQNPSNPLDVNGDGFVSPFDALWVIDVLSHDGAQALGTMRVEGLVDGPFVDVNGDDFMTPIDALIVIDGLNQSSPVAEGEGTAVVDLGVGLLLEDAIQLPLQAAPAPTAGSEAIPDIGEFIQAVDRVVADVGGVSEALAGGGSAGDASDYDDLLDVLATDLILLDDSNGEL